MIVPLELTYRQPVVPRDTDTCAEISDACSGRNGGTPVSKRLPAPPPVLGGYTYIRPLGTGGFADVFLFEQDMPRRLVAVKVLLQDIVDSELLRMFNAEADVMARLSSHPSILTVYQAGISADGRPYIVMEQCPTSLTNRYRREQIPVAEVLHIGVKIGSALETAHRAGLLHRDIKPSNILFTSFGSPVLSDFGIATSVSGNGDEVLAMSVPWSSPEVVDERVAGSIAAEVWSLGATMYSLLAGRSPFEIAGAGQNSRDQLRARISRAKYVPVGRADLPASLEAVLQKSMSKDPFARHSSAAEFAHEFQLVQHELGMPHSALEIATDEWASAGAPINFNDSADRGPIRSSVAYDSRRPQRVKKSALQAATTADGTVIAGSEKPAPRTVSVKVAVLLAVGLGLLVAATAAVLVLMIGR